MPPPAGARLPLVGSRAPTQRRALELLADCHRKAVAKRFCYGFTVEQMVELVRSGLATATAQRVKAGRSHMEVATLRITEAGRRMLATTAGD
jgi:hypothetical protein